MEELTFTHWALISIIIGALIAIGAGSTKAARLDPRWGWGPAILIVLFWWVMIPVGIWKLLTKGMK